MNSLRIAKRKVGMALHFSQCAEWSKPYWPSLSNQFYKLSDAFLISARLELGDVTDLYIPKWLVFHEAGHTIAALALEGNGAVKHLSMLEVAGCRAWNFIEDPPLKNLGKIELLNVIAKDMAGFAAEEFLAESKGDTDSKNYFQKNRGVSKDDQNYVSGDLKNANKIALVVLNRFGVLQPENSGLSQEEKINEILDYSYSIAKVVVKKNWTALEALVTRANEDILLLENEIHEVVGELEVF